MGVYYALHWESYNLALFILCILLLIWLIEAQSRFVSALKYRAASMAGTVAVVRGLGSYASIFQHPAPDHLSALRQRRAPAAVVDVSTMHIPVDVARISSRTHVSTRGGPSSGLGSDHSASFVHLSYRSSCTCILTPLTGVDLSILNTVSQVVADGKISGRLDSRSIEDENRVCSCIRIYFSSRSVTPTIRLFWKCSDPWKWHLIVAVP